MNIDITPKEYHILKDCASSSDKERPWREKKMKALMIAKSYERIGYTEKAAKVLSCGTFLAFREYVDNSFKLHAANFCKVRLCSMCAWRRSLKIFHQVSKVMEVVKKEMNKSYKGYSFLFLTLTQKNVKGEELSAEISKMMLGYKFLFEQKCVKRNVVGAFRCLEITHNTDKKSKSFDTYHPHFHVVMMVKNQYFSKHGYIHQRQWIALWQKAMNLDYEPSVQIKKVQYDADDFENTISKSILEVAKYTTKDSDILNDDEKLQDSAVKVLDAALHGRRLISFRGEFAKIHKQLGLDDAVDGDLIKTGEDDKLDPELDYIIKKYRWHTGYFQYCQIDDNNEWLVDSKEDVNER